MMELEIQGLAASREGLLVEMGRLVLAAGFTVRRQRLVHDPHGILLTMVVRGPDRRQQELEHALTTYARLIGYNLSPYVDGELRPHFAASQPPSPVPAPSPAAAAAPPSPAATSAMQMTTQPAVRMAPAAVPVAPQTRALQPEPVAEIDAIPLRVQAPPAQQEAALDPARIRPMAPAPKLTPTLEPEPKPEPESKATPEPDFEFIQPITRTPAAAPVAPVQVTPFVEKVPLGPDTVAVDRALSSLENDYPDLWPKLLALQAAVPEAARETSLELAGRRTGGWVFAHQYAQESGLGLLDAISRIGAPALLALAEVDQQDEQLHIHNSPLCTGDGHSGCSFFTGFLEGLLGPATASGSLSIFPVCCRSYGADDCVLAISE